MILTKGKTYRNYLGFSCLVLLIVCLAACNKKVDAWQEHGYIEGRFTFLSSSVGGKLVSLPVKRGDIVKQGQLTFSLDSDALAADVAFADAELKQAQFNFADLQKGKRSSEIKALIARRHEIEVQRDFARKEVARYRVLLKQKHLEEREFDVAVKNLQEFNARLAKLKADLITAKLPARQDAIQVAYAQLQGAEARLKRARWQLEQTHITAPKAGYVYDTFYRLGEVVPPNTPVLSLMTPGNIKAVFFVGAKNLSKIALGDKVQIYCVDCEQSVDAEIEFISPRAEYTPPVIYSEGSREKLVYRVEARFKQPLDKLSPWHPGQPIDVRLTARKT